MKDIHETRLEFCICCKDEFIEKMRTPFAPTRRRMFMLVFSSTDRVTYYVNRQPIEIPPFSLLFINPDWESHCDPDTRDNVYALGFTHTFYSRTMRDSSFLKNSSLFFKRDQPFIFTPPPEGQEYYDVLIQLLYKATKKNDQQLHQDLAHNIIQQILILSTMYGIPEIDYKFIENADHELTLKFKDLIPLHYQEHKSVGSYAERLSVSPRRLAKATTNSMGKLPKAIINEYLTEEAKWMLKFSTMNIKQIANQLGFSDENNFSAFFSKEMGVPPSAYRQKA